MADGPGGIPVHFVDDDGGPSALPVEVVAVIVDSPALTGNPTAPTPSAGDNDTSIATTAFVTAAGAALIIDSIADADATHAPSRNAVFDALALKAPAACPESGINTQTADYTLVAADAGALVLMNKATAIALSIPTNANVAFAVGTRIDVVQIGAGQVTVAAVTPGTTTVLSRGGTAASPKTAAQYSGVSLIKDATDHWYVIGDLV